VGLDDLTKGRRLLILGPSFRRRKDDGLIPAFERYDGLFFRVARKHLDEAKGVDVVVMTDDLTLLDGSAPMSYEEPEGTSWGDKTIMKKTVESAKVINEDYMRKKLKGKKYREVFVAMGKEYAAALPDLSQYGIIVKFPASGGPGPKAQALKEWFNIK
jgi:hypothetical protein